MTTGSFHDGVRFKITSCACVIVKALLRECCRAPVHDLSSLAFTSTSQRPSTGVSKVEYIGSNMSFSLKLLLHQHIIPHLFKADEFEADF